jgi:molybdenum storage protein
MDELVQIHMRQIRLILADLIDARNRILIKDEKGLYSYDPKKISGAEFIPKVGIRELLKMDLDDLIIERPCLEILQNSWMIHQI